MKLAVGQNVTVKRKPPEHWQGHLLFGVVIAVSENHFTVKNPSGWKESILFSDIRAGRAKIVMKEEAMDPVGSDKAFTEVLKEKGLTGLLSEAMVAKVPREKITELLDKGYTTRKAAHELQIGQGTYINLKKFYDLMDYEKGPKPAENVHEPSQIQTGEEHGNMNDAKTENTDAGGNRSMDASPQTETLVQVLTVDKPILELNYSGAAGVCHKLANGIVSAIADLGNAELLDIQFVVRRA